MAVGVSCPQWCVDHHPPDPGEPGDGGRHFGPEHCIDIADAMEIGMIATAFVQLNAYDLYGRRHSIIDLVDPRKNYVELSAAQARAVAAIVVSGAAQAAATPDDGECPSWCLGHDSDGLAEDVVVHRGLDLIAAACGPDLEGTPVIVQVCAVDLRGERTTTTDLILGTAATELDTAAAWLMAAHLLNCADLLET